MKSVNIAEFRAHFGQYLAEVERGAEVQLCKRNKSVARLVKTPVSPQPNATRLGCARGTVRILGDITAPAVADDAWEMLR